MNSLAYLKKLDKINTDFINYFERHFANSVLMREWDQEITQSRVIFEHVDWWIKENDIKKSMSLLPEFQKLLDEKRQSDNQKIKK